MSFGGAGYDLDRDIGIKGSPQKRSNLKQLQIGQPLMAAARFGIEGFKRTPASLRKIAALAVIATLSTDSGVAISREFQSPSVALVSTAPERLTCDNSCINEQFHHIARPLLKSSTTLHEATSTTSATSTLPKKAIIEAKPTSTTTVPASTTTTIKVATSVEAASIEAVRYDLAWPQCNYDPKILPPSPESIVGTTDGEPNTTNPCFVRLSTKGGEAHMFYVMGGARGPDGYQYGYSFGKATAELIVSNHFSGGIFIDIEMGKNSVGQELWTPNTAINIAAIQGAQQAIEDEDKATNGQVYFAGDYSNHAFMGDIAGSWRPNADMWYTTGTGDALAAKSYCHNAGLSFANGNWSFVQYQPPAPPGEVLDMDAACS